MRYLILGTTQARDDSGAPLPLGGARLRALLAALALRAGGPAVPVSVLVDEVWGEDPPQDAPAALQALVSRLRRALGGKDTVQADPTGGYRLPATRDDVDLYVFQRLARQAAQALSTPTPTGQPPAPTLRTALTLWRGPALADLPDPATRASHATGPEAQRAAAVRDLIEAELRTPSTDPATLLPEIEALIAAHPYDEPLRAQHLRALRAAGRTADALAAYDRTRRALAEGLGTDPGPELTALHADLLRPAPAPTPAPAPERRGNLRPRLTSFVGREPELAALHTDLSRARLVTLTGPGGSGKTRLAEHAGAQHAARADHTTPLEPVWLVELARLDHPAAVPAAVLSALGLRDTALVGREKPAAAQDPTAQLLEHCAQRRLLLVLDNCEHVIGAAAELAERLLTHCPGVRILATSREPLGVPGENVRPVEPLPPDPAHRLFADRGAAARPGFTVADDPAAVAEICARLDGLPLAIELAAARLRLLTPRQIADRLDNRFRLLTSGSRTVLPRQQTLRAVVDWSWDLLDASERTVLRRLSVFAGGCDLTAAEAVCADPGPDGPDGPDLADIADVADVLGALVDKSLVLADPAPATAQASAAMRYRMLETIHEYAAERAAEDPADRSATARRHAAHFTTLAEEAEPFLRSAAQLPWIARIETELDNLRTAFTTSISTTRTSPADPETAVRLAFALGWFWWLRNYRTEGAEWTARVVDLDPAEPPLDTPAYWNWMRLQLLSVFLMAETRPVGEFRTPERLALAERLQHAFRRPGPETARFPGMLWPLTSYLTGDALDFHRGLDETVANCRAYAGDWELGVTLMLRTHVAIDITGGLPTVDADLAELHEIARRVGDRWTRAQVSSAAGEVALSRGQYDWARAEYEECLRLAREVGAHFEAPFALTRIAQTAYCTGDSSGALRLLAAADAEADSSGGSDVRAFSGLLAGMIALDQGDPVRARAEHDRALAESLRTTMPAQFSAGLANLEAHIKRLEEGPDAGLAVILPTLEAAVTGHCAEQVLAVLAETAAALLADADRCAESVRALAAAGAWRGGLPRSVPEEGFVRGLPERTRAALGAEAYDREAAAGAALSPRALLATLTAG
ncbi:AAA family ATPase [Streptomyces sp. NBC_00536]|uniref:BTAD domain-containing putative transcriptional regulator n=1 Tax=Streptomyces sp. NBC_00536 TaxID=2975769 RepID=UPI002E7FF950|nr:BTAD domain-containing putative transcriptional regulator [Streptomyces sp. NBC_00536]WUC80297.1 AAA family ATPase [Streptomyces sp. NBC_00536]